MPSQLITMLKNLLPCKRKYTTLFQKLFFKLYLIKPIEMSFIKFYKAFLKLSANINANY